MSMSLLNYFVIGQLSAFLLIFCRVGATIMVMPGIGEMYVPARIRMLFAVAFTVLLTPILQSKMPALASNVLLLFVQLMGEIVVGIFIGLIARAILSVVHVAGTIIAVQSSLSMAAVFDPINGSQSPVISNLLTIGALMVFFALDLHHLVLAAIVQSYDLFTPGQFPQVADMNVLHLRVVADSFTLGVMLAAPHIVFSLLFYLAGGLVSRVVPNFQIFFVMMSPQIMLGLLLLFAVIPIVLQTFGNYMQEQLTNFVTVQ